MKLRELSGNACKIEGQRLGMGLLISIWLLPLIETLVSLPFNLFLIHFQLGEII